MNVLTRIVKESELTQPDGRPLYRYRLSKDAFVELEEVLRSHVRSRNAIDLAAPQFVLWAAEHIRSRFAGGPLKWAFVLSHLGLPSEDQDLGRRLAKQGLSWWKREVKQSDAGHWLFLYSLLAEGGFPEALLKEASSYRSAVEGLLKEIEAEGSFAAEPSVEYMALRWRYRLPQTFQSTDFSILLAHLALSLAELRALLPRELPDAGVERWLDKHRPDWTSSLPLRLTPEVAESLISPVLRLQRDIRPIIDSPLCERELCRGANGSWQGYLNLHDNGWLQERYFSEAAGLRLRLLSSGPGVSRGVAYSATPEEHGWRLSRLGKSGRMAIPLQPNDPFALSAFADGQAKGEAVVDAGIPHPIETPSFWRPAELSHGASTDRLTPLTGAARTRGSCLWILMSESEEPEASDGLNLDDIEAAPGGFLWRLSGNGILNVRTKRYKIQTGAKEDAPEARLFAFGETLRGFRLDGNVPVYRGDIVLHGQLATGHSIRVPESELRSFQGRELCSEILEWVRNDEVLARHRLVRVPKFVSFTLHEVSAGRIVLSADGLAPGWRIRIGAGENWESSELPDGAAELTLDTPGTAPGIVRLRLSEPVSGRSLELQAAWPARSGMIIDSNGARLERTQPISVDALQGWRALTPDGMSGDLQLQLTGYRAVSLPIAGEVSVASHLPSIQAMLAHGGPDSQVSLSLVVSGQEGPRLEIRRYHENAVVEGGFLQMGIDRDAPPNIRTSENAIATQLNEVRRAIIRATSLTHLDRVGPIETSASVDLANHLEQSRGPWLIQSTLEERAQRAVVWNPMRHDRPTREQRTADYIQHWHDLLNSPQNTDDWDRMWQLISAVGENGDIGVLDQIQALANVPAAAISRALRVPSEELSEVLALETAAPILWPTLKVSDFATAVRVEHSHLLSVFSRHFDDDSDATEMADHALTERIRNLLLLRPDLTGHFCVALLDTKLFLRLQDRSEIRQHISSVRTLVQKCPKSFLTEAAQEAVKRFDRLPQGVGDLHPPKRPEGFPSFNPYAQSMIDAPLVAAEMATERRSEPDMKEKLALINLRLIDPLYFDTALPLAITFFMRSDNQ